MKNKYRAKTVEIDGMRFDSVMEMSFYLHLIEKRTTGQIEAFKRQPKFVLQPAFTKNGKKYQAITYVADFDVTYPDGRREIIDVKGMQTQQGMLRVKMFNYHYPDLTLKLVTECPKIYGGGFIEIEELKRLRKARKKG